VGSRIPFLKELRGGPFQSPACSGCPRLLDEQAIVAGLHDVSDAAGGLVGIRSDDPAGASEDLGRTAGASSDLLQILEG